MINLSFVADKLDKAVEEGLKKVVEEVADRAAAYVPEDSARVRESIKAVVDGTKVRGFLVDGDEWSDEADTQVAEEVPEKKKGQHTAIVGTDDDDGAALEYGTRTREAVPFLSRALYEVLDSGKLSSIMKEELRRVLK